MEILKSIATALIAPIIALGSFLGFTTEETPNAGATIPTVIALYEDSLASSIGVNDTSFSLVRGTDKTGRTLATSTYPFIIDEGTASEEMVIADCVGVTCTNVIRGVDPLYGTSTTSSLKKSHRRGASVKITTGPQLITISRVLQGDETFPSALTYDDSVSTTSLSLNGQNLASVAYANSLSFGDFAASASENTAGYVEIATGVEAASSTTSGSAARLALPASLATSTSPASGHVVPITNINGDLDSGFIPDTITGTKTFSGTTTFSGPVVHASSTSILVYTASTTYTKPANLSYIVIEVVGGGGGGATCTSNDCGGGGGGSGAYTKKVIYASQLSATTSVVIGSGGAANTTGGTSTFTGFATSTGGVGASSGSAQGASGGTASGGNLNINGGAGDTSGGDGYGGTGGSNPLGYGGAGATGNGGGGSGTGYGAGGGGASTSANSIDQTGGSGISGVVVITQYFN